MALLIDWGGVLTTSMLASFDAFARREGADVRTAFQKDATARGALVDLETGTIDIATFEERLGRALGVDPHDLANRLTQDVHPDQEMLDAPIHDRWTFSANSLEAFPADVPEPPPGEGKLDSKALVKTEDGANWVIFVLADDQNISSVELNNLGCAYGRRAAQRGRKLDTLQHGSLPRSRAEGAPLRPAQSPSRPSKGSMPPPSRLSRPES